MELRHLRYFIAVAEEKHMTRAAERLGIQQPPLSMQIRALEQELDVQLFRRQPRGMELTDAGVAFLERARVILDQVDRALATTRRTARGEQGRVAVGFTSSAPFHPFVPRVIRAFREMSPLVSLVLEESGSSELVQGLNNEEIDAAFIRSPVADVVGLTVRPLLQEKMVVALPKGHPLASAGRKKKSAQNRTAPLPLADLATETFILYKRPGGPGLYDDSVTPNVNLDNQLSDQAGWRLHLGTVNEDRWPSIAIRLHGTPTLIPSWATMPFGGRMTFANPPSQVAPDLIDTIIEGWSERWDTESWDATLATSPYSPYVIAIVSDPATLAEVARIGSATATLGADISSGATSFSIVSGSGGLWTTDPTDFPLDVNIGGERIRLSAIAGAASPQTATVSARSVNAVVKAHTANDPIEVWRIATVGLA